MDPEEICTVKVKTSSDLIRKFLCSFPLLRNRAMGINISLRLQTFFPYYLPIFVISRFKCREHCSGLLLQISVSIPLRSTLCQTSSGWWAYIVWTYRSFQILNSSIWKDSKLKFNEEFEVGEIEIEELNS